MRQILRFLILFVTTISCLFAVTEAISARPFSYHELQPDGTETPQLYMRGSAKSHYIIDDDGFIVVQNISQFFVYATLGANGAITPSEVIVGKNSTGVKKLSVKNLSTVKGMIQEDMFENQTFDLNRPINYQRTVGTKTIGRVQNLVILVKFADHKDRILPTKSSFEILFNTNGVDKLNAPTGSIRDFYLYNSYNSLDLKSTVYDWIQVPYTEESIAKDSETIAIYALNYISNSNFSFSKVGGGIGAPVDMVTILHSGYGGEWGQVDCYGKNVSQRVWSHQSYLTGSGWRSRDGIQITMYSISTALWDICGSAIGRIGVIVHEMGHVLGLPDLYDDNGGCGTGSYDVMASAWGFDGSQLYPPMFSPWSKILLKWITPTILSSNGEFSITQSANTTSIYRVDVGFPTGEYILIENRQNIGYDVLLKQGGLAIWHIDEKANRFTEGYPKQSGWPMNGNHYNVALLQADGQYDLEHDTEAQGSGDLFRSDGVDQIGPSWNFTFGPFPNTDAYQNGNMKHTGIRIYDIGSSALSMTFSISFGTTLLMGNLTTTFKNDNGSDGNMFSIIAKKSLSIRGMAVHMMSDGLCAVEVWMKNGSYIGYEHSQAYWKNIASVSVHAMGSNFPTPLPSSCFDPIRVAPSQMISFYVTISGKCGTIRYSMGKKEGAISASNDDLTILEGIGSYYPFKDSFAPRLWNGALFYDAQESDLSAPSTMKPIFFPTRVPTKKVTKRPSIRPTWRASRNVTKRPTSKPTRRATKQPTRRPSKQPKRRPSKQPTRRPSRRPTWRPSRRPTRRPSRQQTRRLSKNPTRRPSRKPTGRLSQRPTLRFLNRPTIRPTRKPTRRPTSKLSAFRTTKTPALNSFLPTMGSFAAMKTLVTTYEGGSGSAGSMFSVTTKKALTIHTIDFHILQVSSVPIEVWMKNGSYSGFETTKSAWTNILSTKVNGVGFRTGTRIPLGDFLPIKLDAFQTVSFYVTISSSKTGLIYTIGTKEGKIFVANQDLVVLEGIGVEYPFGKILSPRVWNGAILYTSTDI